MRWPCTRCHRDIVKQTTAASLNIPKIGGTTTTRHRSKEATPTHSLSVACTPTNDLQKYDPNGNPVELNGKPVLAPGKADAYRFMTFYLAQDSAHFDDFYNKSGDPRLPAFAAVTASTPPGSVGGGGTGAGRTEAPDPRRRRPLSTAPSSPTRSPARKHNAAPWPPSSTAGARRAADRSRSSG
ncbi:hypothetical protein [Streptomyces sp. NPDC059256]|uniref:hypothetical protein n=1 Tax=Streptomyces sp. NPDC059256 TaxID=3346794 RepID=UPI0036C55FAF